MNMMHSFLPNDCPLINALKCCGNRDCGKKAEPFTTLKMCTACRSMWYCNVDCQKTHRKYHKHQCKQDAINISIKIKSNAEASAKKRRASNKTDGSVHNDDDNEDELFQPIPPQDDCPLCAHPLSIDFSNIVCNTCCGNLICKGCDAEDSRVTLERGHDLRCAFCRAPVPSLDSNEQIIRLKKRIEMNDSTVIFMASQNYSNGNHGVPKDPQKAFDLCIRAAELGNSEANCNAAHFYREGVVVPKDMIKASDYIKKAAKGGNLLARHILGVEEVKKYNCFIGSRHWLISAAAGYSPSLKEIANLFMFKFVTKEEYATTLASYRNVHKNEWSIERDAEIKREKRRKQEREKNVID